MPGTRPRTRASANTLLVLKDPAGRASWNMALDEALLEAQGSCWLRFYSWQPHAISLGYFQKLCDFAAEAQDFDLVRRPTGGGAILHAHELTFSLALPESLLPGSARSSYSLINRALIQALASFGVGLQEPPESKPATGAWCFADAVGMDLVQEDGRKVVGCAQRRRQGRVLHHGSLVLERHARTGFTGSLSDCGLPLTAQVMEQLVDRLLASIASTLGLAPHEIDKAPPTVLERAMALEEQRYASPSWTARR